jgi:hypothetical protein
VKPALVIFLMICVLPIVEGQRTAPGDDPDSKQAKSAISSEESVAAQSACTRLKVLHLPYTDITAGATVPAGPFAIPLQGAVPPAIDLPAFCRVQGVFRPTKDSEIRFEVWMPVSGWNGRFEQVGNGGFAGNIAYGSIASELLRGYATASTDDGHEASVIDASWAIGHPEKVIDYGYRAVHETSVSAKEFVRTFYGIAPSYSYFNGCSNGGREALMEAQRFPEDFNGIIAGSPANFFTHLMAGFMWTGQVLTSTSGSYIPVSKLPAIQAAAVAACDASDGVKDGILEDPQSCHFDPAVLQCKDEDRADCLTAPQVAAARKIYSGPHNPRTGKQIFPGYEPGAEATPSTWPAWIIGQKPGSSLQTLFGNEFFANMVFENPKWDLHTFNLVGDTRTADSKLGRFINSTNPDLRQFKAHGGKLIQYHGWADAAISPLESVNYYESVVDKMGGLEKTQEFYQLYMAPGMEHCGGGPGPNSIRRIPHAGSLPVAAQDDVLDVLVRWVEHGVAPENLVAAKFTDDDPTKAIVATRPLCPYPQLAKYKGTGSTNDAANFVCESGTNGTRRNSHSSASFR